MFLYEVTFQHRALIYHKIGITTSWSRRRTQIGRNGKLYGWRAHRLPDTQARALERMWISWLAATGAPTLPASRFAGATECTPWSRSTTQFVDEVLWPIARPIQPALPPEVAALIERTDRLTGLRSP